ncbi:MAG: hypothetical protein WA705_05200 [Candidatus Ozemobacteraceae bacterium]
MKIVIQCAGGKQPDAPSFVSTSGKPILFVSRPTSAPLSESHVYARPDDLSDDDKTTWRTRLWEYNKSEDESNPLGLFPAFQLYKNPIYKALVDRFSVKQIYILSAGWGLIPADFLTPNYNITFSNVKPDEPFKHRGKKDRFDDFCMLPDDDDIRFLGGADYRPLFCKLTGNLKGVKTVYFRVDQATQEKCLDLPAGFSTRKYPTTQLTNWHYSCAKDLISGKIP